MKVNSVNLLNVNYLNNAPKTGISSAISNNSNMVSFSKEACAGLKALSFCSKKHIGETGLSEVRKIAKDALIETITIKNAAKRHILNSRKLNEYAQTQYAQIQDVVKRARLSNFSNQYGENGKVSRSFVAFNTKDIQDVVIMNEFYHDGKSKRSVYFTFGEIEKIVDYSKDSKEAREFVFEGGELKSCTETSMNDRNGDYFAKYEYKNSKLSHFSQNKVTSPDGTTTLGASFRYEDEAIRSYQENFTVSAGACTKSGRKVKFAGDKITYLKGWEDQPTGVRKKDYTIVFEKSKLAFFDEGNDILPNGDEIQMGSYNFENDTLVAYDGGHCISSGIKKEAGKVYMPNGVSAEVLLAVQEN